MNIAIAGFGIEGRANYAYWAQNPENTITIVDERPLEVLRQELQQAVGQQLPNSTLGGALPRDLFEKVATRTGAGAFSQLNGYDLVVRTAGLAPYKIVTNGRIWSGTNEFFAQCPAPIIGVTGSKGKGTTASFIASILQAAGKKVWLVGNIGRASLEILHDIQPSDVVV